MSKIRFFLLQVLFLCVPLIYAWLYIPGFSWTLADSIQAFFPQLRWHGFESVKVFFFLCIMIGVSVAALSEYLLKSKHHLSEGLLISFLVFSVWSITSYTLNADLNIYFLFGTPEKSHGWFLYFFLFILFWVLYFTPRNEQKRLWLITFIGFFGVTAYAFFQRFGLDPLASFYNSRLDPWRIFTTLGNPNYLAGYVLMILPLLRVYRFPNELSWQEHLWEICVWIFAGILIYWTGSYLAWILFALYVGYVLVEHIFTEKRQKLFFWFFGGAVIVFFVLWAWMNYAREILDIEKMKGFIARWYLWKTGIAAITHDIWRFLFGFGPDSFLLISEKFRHPLLSGTYEDPLYKIDRSHNIFIDTALHFGVPVTLALVGVFIGYFRHMSHDKKIALLLFAVYFSFNIPVLVHFLILIQILASAKK